MPDWKPEIRRRLPNLQLPPTREAAIVEELAQHLDDCSAELLVGGATTDEAYRAALAGVGIGLAARSRSSLVYAGRQQKRRPAYRGCSNCRTSTSGGFLLTIYKKTVYSPRNQ